MNGVKIRPDTITIANGQGQNRTGTNNTTHYAFIDIKVKLDNTSNDYRYDTAIHKDLTLNTTIQSTQMIKGKIA
ncbi:MAG: hypothetical protein ABI045_00040 [Flavobacteriales bacterium]